MKLIHCILVLLLLASCGNQPNKEQVHHPPEQTQPLFDLDTMPAEPLFDIETTHGTMRIKLYKETPGHRDNFAKLVAERYYDGILFHRIVKGFMIQAGGLSEKPTKAQLAYGERGVSYTIPAEFTPGLTHKRGALAAARSDNPQKASSGSQFYIVHNEERARGLNGEYTVYGEVIDGFDVLDKIANDPVVENPNMRGERSRPVKAPIIISIKPVF